MCLPAATAIAADKNYLFVSLYEIHFFTPRTVPARTKAKVVIQTETFKVLLFIISHRIVSGNGMTSAAFDQPINFVVTAVFQ